jgi:hypothetical protein
VKFVGEGIVWFKIARKWRTRFVNERLLMVYRQEGPVTDHLSRLTRTTARGRLIFHKSVLDEHLEYLLPRPSGILRSLANYSRYSFFCGVGVTAQWRGLKSSTCRLALPWAVPVGYLLYLRDRWGDRTSLHSW